MNAKTRKWKTILSFDTNDVIKALTISDLFILSSFGLIAPIFAVYLTDNIKGANLEVVGVAATIFLLTRSLGQLPVAYIVDKIKGEKDDFWVMVIGSLISSLVPLFYIIATETWHIYLIQLIYGLSQAFTYPSWLAIFTRHIDKKREGFEWGIYYTLTDLGGAVVAVIGGIVASSFGFTPLFIIVSVTSFMGSLWLMVIRKRFNTISRK